MPVELLPPPRPNRQSLWLWWARRYAAKAVLRVSIEIIHVGTWLMKHRCPVGWIFRIGMALGNLGVRLMPGPRADR